MQRLFACPLCGVLEKCLALLRMLPPFDEWNARLWSKRASQDQSAQLLRFLHCGIAIFARQQSHACLIFTAKAKDNFSNSGNYEKTNTVVFSWDRRRWEHLPNKRTRGRRWIQPAHVGSSKEHNAHREILSPTSGHVAGSELSASSACLRHLGRITRQAESTSRVLIGSGHQPMKARPKLELNSSKRRGHCEEGRADLTWMQGLVLIHALWSTAWFPLLSSLRAQRWVRRLHSAR